MLIYLVEQHVSTADKATGGSIGQPFTGSDIRRIVYQTADQDAAEQYADVSNLVNRDVWVKGYLTRPVWVDFE